ncbi:hypothetical protein UPYG_G00256000 [Umbra pygmaea]|uniref:Uncharacterized protein n=1 Tax=Umbra pygmaea TaxID=75934 RepID=A0ABD0WCW4_UMBPY
MIDSSALVTSPYDKKARWGREGTNQLDCYSRGERSGLPSAIGFLRIVRAIFYFQHTQLRRYVQEKALGTVQKLHFVRRGKAWNKHELMWNLLDPKAGRKTGHSASLSGTD